MLHRLARWLRAAGYDTAMADHHHGDRDILDRAIAEDRLLLTCDRKMLERKHASRRVRLLPANDLLAQREPLSLDVLGPAGNGFTLEANTRRLLLVAHTAQLAPLISLAYEATRAQIAVALLVEHDGPQEQTAALLAFLGSLLPIDVEYQIVAHAAPLLPDLLRWCDQVCAAGEPALYAGLRAAIAPSAAPAGFAQVLLLPEIACGTGACLGCAVETAHGTRLACVDGPVFDVLTLQALTPGLSLPQRQST